MNELYHHGVKGQKWGVRRYQNEDGTLTAKGRKRYGTDLDINDKSRSNIAKIRTGEARRRLDVAKANNKTNTTRIADLQARVRSAKRNEGYAKDIDKGSKLAAKGQTIMGNRFKQYMAIGAAGVASKGLNSFLNMRLSQLQSEGRCTAGHLAVASGIAKIGSLTMSSLALGYSVKKEVDNSRLRIYNNSRYTGDATIKSIGSQEYADVVKRRTKGD